MGSFAYVRWLLPCLLGAVASLWSGPRLAQAFAVAYQGIPADAHTAALLDRAVDASTESREDAGGGTGAGTEPDATLPRDAASIVAGAARIADEREELDRVLASLTDTDARERVLADGAALLDAFDAYLDRFAEESFFRSRVLSLHSRLITARSRLSGVTEQTATDAEVVQSLRDTWQRRRRAWSPATVQGFLHDRERRNLAPQIQGARTIIEDALRTIDARLTVLANLHARALDLHARSARQLQRLDRELAEDRQVRMARQEAPLWQGSAREELAAVEFASLGERMTWWDPGFVARSRGTVLLHVVLVAILFFFVRTLPVHAAKTSLQTALWDHPLRLGLFIATSVLGVAYQPAPPIIEALLWSVLGGAGALLAARALPHGTQRRVALAMASAYPCLALVDALGLPNVVLRWVFASTAALGGLGVFWLRRTWNEGPSDDRVWRVVLGACAVALGVAALAEAFGFVSLGRYLLGATARTGMLMFTILVLLAWIDGTVEGAVTWAAARVSPRWRGVVPHLGRRLGWFLQALLVIHGALTVLHAWELIPPVNEAWAALGGFSWQGAGLRISVANVGLAVLSVYLSRQIAWVFELVLDGTVLERHDLDAGIANSIKTLARYVLVGVGVIVALGLLGIGLRNIAILAGALGIGIGFGLQAVVADLTSGIILLLERPLRTGDAVLIAEQWGVVKEIGLRSTVLRLIDESELVIPNSHMTTEKVRNFTLSSRAGRLFIPLAVVYGTDLELAFRTLEEVATRDDEVLVEPAPEVLFIGMTDGAFNVELRVWIRRADNRFSVRSRLLRLIEARWRECGIELYVPRRDLRMREFPVGDAAPAPAAAPSGGASGEPAED